MTGCCSSPGNDEVFSEGVARRTAWRYRRFGLVARERAIVGPLVALGVEGRTVLEIGGGVGQLQLALLDAGAAHAVNLELSPHYEVVADRLAATTPHRGRIERRLGDAAHLDEPLPSVDVAVLHRVLCCTDDWRGMLDAALATAPDTMAITLPHDGLVPSAVGRVGNRLLTLTRGRFRMRHHPPDEVVGHVEEAAFVVAHDDTGLFWRTVVLRRTSRARDR